MAKKVVADGSLRLAKIVPDVTLNWCSQALHLKAAGLVAVDAEATAAGANRLALGGGPTDQLEGVAGFLVRHAGDLRQTERPGLCREKEVLRHEDQRFPLTSVISVESDDVNENR